MKRTGIKRKTALRRVSRKKAARAASKAGQEGRAHMAAVATMRCITCGYWPSQVHHCISGRYGQRKADNLDTIPLCLECHLGKHGIHTNKAAWEAKHGPDYSYLELVNSLIRSMT